MIPMKPAAPTGWRMVEFAKDQPEYHTLPAAVSPEGVVLTEWEPSAEELHQLCTGGRVRLWVYTFGRGLQPVAIDVTSASSTDGEGSPKS